MTITNTVTIYLMKGVEYYCHICQYRIFLAHENLVFITINTHSILHNTFIWWTLTTRNSLFFKCYCYHGYRRVRHAVIKRNQKLCKATQVKIINHQSDITTTTTITHITMVTNNMWYMNKGKKRITKGLLWLL